MKLHAENLTVLRGEDVVIDKLSFSLSAGHALVVTGPNGVGKSTLLRAIAGLLPPEIGRVWHEDTNGEFGEAQLRELVHYLGQGNAMKPALTVGENLTFWQNSAGQPQMDVAEALDMVGLAGLDSVPFAHLSTGQRRRIAIARLLVSYRPFWLLDEPTSGLDAASERQFADLMNVHLEDGGMIVVATHVPLDLANASALVLEPVA